jgi:Zn-dependent peptidase ImmA (M78 family)
VSPAAQLASLLIEHLKIAGTPDLDEVCHALGLRVREKDLVGFEGTLVRSRTAQKGIIGVKRSVREASRKRFTVAHEIGHFVIPYHKDLETACGQGVIDRFNRDLPRPELEANEFAAELLLPSKIVRSHFDLKKPSLANISVVAADFQTSLTATSWRYLDLTDAACAIVWSRSGRAVWYRTSDAVPFKLPLRDLPAPGSVAGRIFAGEEVVPGPEEVDAELWFYPSQAERVELLMEDSISLPNYQAVFTLLWITKIQATALTDEEEELLPELDPTEFTLGRQRWPH